MVAGLARWWMGTINNPPRALEEYWAKFNEAGALFIRGQLERGAEGTEHLQFLIGFKDKVRLGHIKKIEGSGHYEPTRSDAARAYVCKEETRIAGPWSFGHEPVRRQAKEDWEKVRNLAIEGRFMDIDPKLCVQHFSNLRALHKDLGPPAPSVERVRGLFFFGPAGTGKSFAARELCGGSAYYTKIADNKWWDGYRGEEFVVIDDIGLEGAKFTGAKLKNWLDIYPAFGECKGSQVAIKAHTIVLTSNYTLQELFGHDPAGLLAPITRRMREIRHYDTPGMLGFYRPITP